MIRKSVVAENSSPLCLGPLVEVAALRVLVVDDSIAQRDQITQRLKMLGVADVHCAEDGICALQLLAREKIEPHLILVDLHMPRMDGVELLRHLAMRKLKCDVVILSAAKGRILAMADRLSRMHGLNLLGVLSKPLDDGGLETLVENIPDRYASGSDAIPAKPDSLEPAVTVSSLRWAIAHSELVVFYQPKVFVSDGKLASVEALVRWQHPQHGLLPPSAFVDIAERSGLMDELTREVFEISVRQLAQWRSEGLAVGVAVNISADSLARLRFPDELEEIAAKHGVVPSSIILEVTESRLVHDDRTVTETLARLSVKGFRLSIDDYGTGFASLQQLRRVPADELKLDRAFVHDARSDEAALAIQSSSAQLSRKLGFTLVAEGIETQDDWDQIASNQYDIGQGYFIARPMPGEEFFRWAMLRAKMRARDVA